jgi:hypothetical protein
MTDHDRRRTDTDAARTRRREQQREWEQTHRGNHLSEAFAQALGRLLDSAKRLPQCDRSAKLHGRIGRLVDAADTHQACVAARELVSATTLALSDDPWWRVHGAAIDMLGTVCEA